jgi:hypothetical protein
VLPGSGLDVIAGSFRSCALLCPARARDCASASDCKEISWRRGSTDPRAWSSSSPSLRASACWSTSSPTRGRRPHTRPLPWTGVTDSVLTPRHRGRWSRLTLSAAISPNRTPGVGEEQHDDSLHLVGVSVEIAVFVGAAGSRWRSRSSTWLCVRYRFSCLTGRASRCPCSAADLECDHHHRLP